ncbi:MAG: DUF4258 domain-containing protein [bacterium]
MGIKIRQIRDAIKNGRVRITDHADEEAVADKLVLDEIYFSVNNGEIIKQYPDDRPYPSCLLFGRSDSGDPVHSVWAYNKQNKWAVLITVYRPDPNLWIDFKKRVKRT